MRSKRIAIIAVALLALTATAGTAFAWFGHKGGHHARLQSFISWRVSQALDDIDATDAQRTRIEAIKARAFALGEEHAKSRPAIRAAVLEQWRAEKPDARAVHQLVDDRVDEIRALAHQAADAALEVHGTLDAKQRAAIEAMITERLGH